MSFTQGFNVRRSTLLIGLLAGIAACSGQSCSCITPIKGGFPLTQRRENGVQTRLTSSFLKYVSDNAATILPGILPGGSTTFNIPPSCGGSTEVCCATPTPMCSLSVDPRSITLTPASPDKLHFTAGLILKTTQNIPIKAPLVGSCVISVDTARSAPMWMTATGDLQLPVDASTRLTGLSLLNAAIDGIDNGDVNLNEPGSGSLCGVADTGIVKGFIISYMKGQVGDLLNGITDGQLCQTCVDKSDCSQVATACAMGKCIGPDGKKCVQLLGIEGVADVGSFLASVSPQTRAKMDLLEAAGGYVTTNTGLSLGVLGGAQADPHNPCVPVVSAPPAIEVAPSVSFQGDVVPGTTTPFHIGIGVHHSHLTTLGYSFWDAGGLCLSVGSDKVAQLSSKTLGIIMPSLMDLVRVDDAPMLLSIRPQNPPTFKLGKGTFKMDGMKKVVDDPLLTIGMKEFVIDFYLFVDDRYVRLATLSTDLELPIGLDTDMTGALVLIAGDVSKSFANLRVTNSVLLAEPAAQLEASFPTVFAAALGPLLSNLAPFSLPSIAGLAISPKVITSTDPDATGAGTFLGIFADVKPGNTIKSSVQTDARLVAVTTPPTSVFAVNARDGRVPSVTVAVPDGAQPREWTYSFDHGTWYPFQNAGTLTLTDPGLWLQGHHVVTVRARTIGVPSSLDPTPVDLPFIIDSEHPKGDFTVDGGRFVSHAADRITPADLLMYRAGPLDREGEGAFVRADALRLPSGVAPDLVRVEVRDEAGNVALLPYRGLVLAPEARGCELGGRTSGTGGVVLVLASLGLLLLRRRSRLALLLLRRRAVLAVLLVPALACHRGPGDGDRLAPTDSIGRSHDIALHDDALHIVAYDTNFGDLAYAKLSVDKIGEPFDWLLVDGDDPDAPSDATTPYRHGHTLPGPDVGRYSAIALDSSGDPRMASYDATNQAVRFSRGPFPFESHEIERGSAEDGVEIGQYPTIALDVYDKPMVAYMAVGLGDGVLGFRAELHVATAKDSSPGSASDWDIAVADTTPISCGGRCSINKACIMTALVNGVANTNPALSTCVAPDLAPCATACGTKEACIKGACTAVVQPPAPNGLPAGTGLFANLARGAGGKIALAYQDASNGQLRVALAEDGGKFLPNVIDGKDPGANMGEFANAAYDGDGTLHLAYRDAILGHLCYRSISASGTPSAQVVVDDGLRDDGPHPVGASASIIADDAGVAILYQDQASSDLLLAQKGGAWSRADVRATDEGSGFSSHVVSGKGQRYYSSWVFDRSATPIGRLVVDRLR